MSFDLIDVSFSMVSSCSAAGVNVERLFRELKIKQVPFLQTG